MPEPYPLGYPASKQRTPANQRERAVFKVTFAKARDELLRELELLGAVKVVISTNVPLRKDGLPYANSREPDDPGVAVYFNLNRKSFVFACDAWDRVKDNLRDIGLTIAEKRSLLQNRKTVTTAKEFGGYEALPPSNGQGPNTWWGVLGVAQTANWTEVKAAYRRAAKTAHPDVGGDRAIWDRIQAAYEQAEKVLQVRKQ